MGELIPRPVQSPNKHNTLMQMLCVQTAKPVNLTLCQQQNLDGVTYNETNLALFGSIQANVGRLVSAL